jgi:Uma2 family endonuclease
MRCQSGTGQFAAPAAATGVAAHLEEFALVCDANPEAVLELAADGRLITMTPTGGETSHRNSRLLTRLQN